MVGGGRSCGSAGCLSLSTAAISFLPGQSFPTYCAGSTRLSKPYELVRSTSNSTWRRRSELSVKSRAAIVPAVAEGSPPRLPFSCVVNWQQVHKWGRDMAYAFDTLGYSK